MGKQGLNTRAKRFAELFAQGGRTATDAYLLAGYKPLKRENAHRAASRLRARAAVSAYIAELRRAADEEARLETIFTIREKLALLHRIATTGAGGVSPDDPIVSYHRTFKDGSSVNRLPCKLKAIKMHSQLAGHFDPTRPEVEPPVDTLAEFICKLRAGKIGHGYEPPPLSPPTPHSGLMTPMAPSQPSAPGEDLENTSETLPNSTVSSDANVHRPESPAAKSEEPQPMTPTQLRRIVYQQLRNSAGPEPFPYDGPLPGERPRRPIVIR